jgi:4-hydroxy-tetrahydrodipicolinate reductase
VAAPSTRGKIMKIALLGYGKMGRMVEEAALKRGHIISAKSIAEITPDADICIDFSHPDAVMNNVKCAASIKKNIVIGTTGWDHIFQQVVDAVQQHQIGMLHSPNFSIGVYLFHLIVEQAAALVNQNDLYDVSGLEVHHSQKQDSPSGTALSLAKLLMSRIQRKTSLITQLNGPIQPHELHFPSVRCGYHPGTHTITFDSPADTITLSHSARNREGFALGAVMAAEWVQGKKGIYTFKDIFMPL